MAVAASAGFSPKPSGAAEAAAASADGASLGAASAGFASAPSADFSPFIANQINLSTYVTQ